MNLFHSSQHKFLNLFQYFYENHFKTLIFIHYSFCYLYTSDVRALLTNIWHFVVTLTFECFDTIDWFWCICKDRLCFDVGLQFNEPTNDFSNIIYLHKMSIHTRKIIARKVRANIFFSFNFIELNSDISQFSYLKLLTMANWIRRNFRIKSFRTYNWKQHRKGNHCIK